MENNNPMIQACKNVMQEVTEQVYNELFGFTPVVGTVQQFITAVASYRDYRLLEKLEIFLKGLSNDSYEKAKMSETFVENEERQEFFQIMIKTLDDIESDKKVKYVTNLTRALLNDFINKDDYFRLINCIRVVLIQDLNFLEENIDKVDLQNNPNVDSLVQNGLMFQSDFAGPVPDTKNKYNFTDVARHLDQYGISYEDEKYTYKRGDIKNLSETSHQPRLNTLGFRYVDESKTN